VTVRHQDSPLPNVGWRSLVGLGALLGLAWVLVALSTAGALQPDPDLYSQGISIVIPTVFALTLFAGGIGIFRYGLLDQTARIAKWTGLGTTGVIAAVVSNSLWISPTRLDFSVALYTLVTAAIGGAVLGFLVGLYDAHQTRLKR
jgi:NhaP-type Na+/H+ or K+/H+ antiporter